MEANVKCSNLPYPLAQILAFCLIVFGLGKSSRSLRHAYVELLVHSFPTSVILIIRYEKKYYTTKIYHAIIKFQ